MSIAPVPSLLAAALAAAFALPAAAQDAAAPAAGDPEAGAAVFRRCAACHAVEADAAKKVGPTLYGIVGRQTASVADYSYSDAMAALGAEGHVWTAEELDRYLENPRAAVPGTKMTFAGLRKAEDRANVIAYLEGLGGAPATN